MLTSVRSLLVATFMTGTVLAAAPAAAQADVADLTITGNAALVSEYRYRGADMSGGDFAIQGGIDVAHSSGLYIGGWGSSMDNDTVGLGHTELNLYGGWGTQVNDALSLDVGALYYVFPNAGPVDSDYVELFGAVGFGFGPGLVSVGINYAPEQDALADTDNLYVFADASVGIPTTPVTLTGHVGYTDGALTFTDDGKAWDWSVGARYAISQNLALGVAYVGAEGDHLPGTYDYTDDTVVFSLTASF